MSTRKKALFVWGGIELHTPERSARVVQEILKPENFECVVPPDYDALGDTEVGGNNLIVPVITGGDLDKQKMDNLVYAVR